MFYFVNLQFSLAEIDRTCPVPSHMKLKLKNKTPFISVQVGEHNGGGFCEAVPLLGRLSPLHPPTTASQADSPSLYSISLSSILSSSYESDDVLYRDFFFQMSKIYTKGLIFIALMIYPIAL